MAKKAQKTADVYYPHHVTCSAKRSSEIGSSGCVCMVENKYEVERLKDEKKRLSKVADDLPRYVGIAAALGVFLVFVIWTGYSHYYTATICDTRWGDVLITVDYRGRIYDTVPREAILGTEEVWRRDDGDIKARHFDLEYLINHKKLHEDRISKGQNVVRVHEWRLGQVEERIAAYRKSLGMDDPKEPKEEKKEEDE